MKLAGMMIAAVMTAAGLTAGEIGQSAMNLEKDHKKPMKVERIGKLTVNHHATGSFAMERNRCVIAIFEGQAEEAIDRNGAAVHVQTSGRGGIAYRESVKAVAFVSGERCTLVAMKEEGARSFRRDLPTKEVAAARLAFLESIKGFRTWRDHRGAEVFAKFAKNDNGTVHLLTETGRTLRLSLEKLSKEDQEHIKQSE